ncbi:MAG: hypothetical protein IKA58_00645 [Clostridia bacterium]|nr:hypothetical protein [Clostridia bacterium]
MSKYSDCIIYSEDMEYPAGRPIPWVAKLDNKPVFECSYAIHWNMPFDEEEKKAQEIPGQRVVGHPPHMHKENEIIFLIGNDPDDPFDLGAEVEMCIGPEMEKFTITRSCCIRIPGGTPHGFYNIRRCSRPWLFVEVQEANPKTEKFRWEYLTPEEKASIPERLMKEFWLDVGYDD